MSYVELILFLTLLSSNDLTPVNFDLIHLLYIFIPGPITAGYIPIFTVPRQQPSLL
jgi:hypothetical protein